MPASPPLSSPARVGYVLKKFPRLSETFILNEILALEERPLPLSIFSLRLPDEGRFHGALGQLKSSVHYLPEFRSAAVLEGFAALGELLPKNPLALALALNFVARLPENRRSGLLIQGLHLARQAQLQGISHLHAHFMTVAAHTAYLAHLFAGLSFSVTAHAKDIFRNTVDRDLFRTVAEAAAFLITVCDANKSYIERELLGGSSARVVRLYNAVPPDFRPPQEAFLEAGLILAIGRLVEKKGFEHLLGACKRLKQQGRRFRCVILGSGELEPRLRALVSRLQLEEQVSLEGAVTREQVLHWIGRAWVLAAPCVEALDGNRDALPTVLLEALAAGLPSVATPVGGIPEIIDHDVDGLLVPAGDPAALADALERVLADQALRTRLSQNGPRKAARKFQRTAITANLAGLFQSAAAPTLPSLGSS